jgi:hypothetical protein
LINKIDSLAQLILRRRYSWFAILPIALLQLTIAVHQFDHVTSYIEGACHVCVQLDRFDAAVDESAETVLPRPTELLRLDAPKAFVTLVPVRHFDARAPPQI